MFAEVVLATRTIGTGSSSLELSSIIKKEQKNVLYKNCNIGSVITLV
jgi:hypothetical protein